jgi:hypothetical protein
VIPEFAEQELVGQDLTGMLHQQAQQVVLLRRQLHLGILHPDDAADQIDR